MQNEITGDPALALSLEHIEATRTELEAINWIHGKTDDQVRDQIHLMYKQARHAGERQAEARGDALLRALNDRRYAHACVAAIKGRP